MRYTVTLLLMLAAAPAQAWNALGHRVIADITWQELTPAKREAVVAILRRHPRYDEDFAKQVPAGVDVDRWSFGQVAVWPDMARGFRGEEKELYDHGTWHYVNFPLFVGGERPLFGVNFAMDYPPLEPKDKWNVGQAVKHCQAALRSDATPSDKALALCWLFHLVGDLHQPLHSTAMFSERFPTGCRGGNSIPVVQGRNLHAFWDGLLGRRDQPNDVAKEVAALKARPELWKVDTKSDVAAWIQESHELAKSFAYSPVIIEATQQPGELQPINLPHEYLTEAGDRARYRVAAAALRLAAEVEAAPIKVPSSDD